MPPGHSHKKLAWKTAVGTVNGHMWLQATKKNNVFAQYIVKVTDQAVWLHTKRGVGDPRALPAGVEQQITALYAQAEFWHGTGRYQHPTGRARIGQDDNSLVDVFDSICKSGCLLPAEEGLALDAHAPSISLAPARMYARTYADTHSSSPSSEPRLGSSLFWASAYLGDTAIQGAKEYKKYSPEQRKRVIENSAGEKGIEGWVTKLRLGGSELVEPPAEVLAKSRVARSKHLLRRSLCASELYRSGSDIRSNYPILMGIKGPSVTSTLDLGKSIGLHEVRTTDPLVLSEALTHIEVPRSKIAETRQLLQTRGLSDLPVIAIEDCEAYLSRFHRKDVYAGRFDHPRNARPPYEVTAPARFDPSFAQAPPLAANEALAAPFTWDSAVKYGAGLIPLRRNAQGEMEVLLLKRSWMVRKGGGWATPGGSCSRRKDGNPLVSAVRETREELGGQLPPGRLSAEPFVLKDRKARRHFYAYPLLVDEESSKVKLNWENSDHQWVPLSAIEPESPELMGECAAVLRSLKDACTVT